MFVQIIEGRTSDADGLRRQVDRWQAEVRPGAAGYLGVTSGVAADGRSIAIVRFESEADARANSDRPEQSAWWSETEKYLGDDVSFTESSDVTPFLGGGSGHGRLRAGDEGLRRRSGQGRTARRELRALRQPPTRPPRRSPHLDRSRQLRRGGVLHQRGRGPQGRADRDCPRSCRPRWPSSRRSWPRPSTSTCRTRSSARRPRGHHAWMRSTSGCAPRRRAIASARFLPCTPVLARARACS